MGKKLVLMSRYDGKKYDAKLFLWVGSALDVKDWTHMRNLIEQQCERKQGKLVPTISQINLYAHGGEGATAGLWVGDDFISEQNSETYGRTLRGLRGCFTKDAVFVFDVCALGFSGKILKDMANGLQIPVRGYRDIQYSNWVSPKGEGPSRLCKPGGECTFESKDDWFDGEGRPIIKK